MSSLLELSNLSLKRGDKSLLNKVNISAQEGDFIFLSGETGVGKSTFFNLISGLEKLSYEGDISIQGNNVSYLSSVERLKLAGIVFQNPNRQFVMKTLRREIHFALENMGFNWSEIVERQKEACDTTRTENLLDRPFSKLSGGEKQRAALAVLLAMDTPIFLLDEPFASVDQAHRFLLINLLSDLSKKGKTIFISDHDESDYSQFVNRHWHFKKGQLVESSPHYLSEKQEYCLVQEGFPQQDYLNFRGVVKDLGENRLWQIPDFSFLKGITTLTGDNGVGKSTLLRSIVQLSPYQGHMDLQGRILKKNGDLYRTLTLTVQEALQQFVTLMPRKELAFSKEQWPDAQRWQELFIRETSLKESMDISLMYLSGGQQKLIQLMAMLSQKVPFLLLDEPFTGLDARACKLVTDWMKSNHQKYDQNFLVVSHRLAPLQDVSHHHVVLAEKSLRVFGQNGVKR